MMQMTNDPETMQVLSSMAMMNMDGEGIEDVRGFFRNRLIKMGALKPTKEEQAQLEAEAANQPPDPNAEYLKAAAAEATAKARKSLADTVLSLAKAENTKADTMDVLSGIDQKEQEIAFQLLREIRAETTQPQITE